MLNACIVILSSRNQCIPHCVKSLWDNFNYKYDYPVYVHYFDDIYDDENFRNSIREVTSQNVHFISVPYKTPDWIPQNELYYNRRDLWYVNSGQFTINRKGYLHMCNFTSNMYGYENTHLHEYDYIMTHDDEAGYSNEVPYNPFEVMEGMDLDMGAYSVNQRLKDGGPHQGHLDTRVGLWEFTKKFIEDNNIVPKTPSLNNLLSDSNAEYNYHLLNWSDTYVIKTKMFETELWKKWIKAVNESGGVYKYRWGDNEIITLFAYIHQNGIYNFNTVNDGIHQQDKFRNLQDYAPGVKDNER